MNIYFYYYPLCPRCAIARKDILALAAEDGIGVKEINIIMNFNQARKDGVLFAPAIKYGKRKISRFMLSKKRIHSFMNSITQG